MVQHADDVRGIFEILLIHLSYQLAVTYDAFVADQASSCKNMPPPPTVADDSMLVAWESNTVSSALKFMTQPFMSKTGDVDLAEHEKEKTLARAFLIACLADETGGELNTTYTLNARIDVMDGMQFLMASGIHKFNLKELRAELCINNLMPLLDKILTELPEVGVDDPEDILVFNDAPLLYQYARLKTENADIKHYIYASRLYYGIKTLMEALQVAWQSLHYYTEKLKTKLSHATFAADKPRKRSWRSAASPHSTNRGFETCETKYKRKLLEMLYACKDPLVKDYIIRQIVADASIMVAVAGGSDNNNKIALACEGLQPKHASMIYMQCGTTSTSSTTAPLKDMPHGVEFFGDNVTQVAEAMANTKNKIKMSMQQRKDRDIELSNKLYNQPHRKRTHHRSMYHHMPMLGKDKELITPQMVFDDEQQLCTKLEQVAHRMHHATIRAFCALCEFDARYWS